MLCRGNDSYWSDSRVCHATVGLGTISRTCLLQPRDEGIEVRTLPGGATFSGIPALLQVFAAYLGRRPDCMPPKDIKDMTELTVSKMDVPS